MAKKNRIPVDRTRAERLLSPLQEFLHQEASSGILLLASTILALLWANSLWGESYYSFWGNRLTIGYGDSELSKPLLLWINDGLMAIFFFVVGLEIKREILIGELASLRKAILPVAAALGGMLIPALIYTAFNRNGAGSSGWGIPMATDIAFALGVLALLGKRVPLSLKVFLTAVAVVDDLGAVLIIAIFYTADILWVSLAIAAVFLALLIICNILGVRNPVVYSVLGIGLWLAFLRSGVHATVAGVLLAMTIPARARINDKEFVEHSRSVLLEFEKSDEGEDYLSATQRSAVQTLEELAEHAGTPLQRLEHDLHPWVAYAIMPIFALANAGLALGAGFLAAIVDPISLGVIFGLIIGKQIGITAFSWLVVKSRLADLPDGVSWRHIYGVSWLAGIGFTMSLFISSLAFGDSPALEIAKSGILLASLTAGLAGFFLLRGIPQPEAR
ncbi:MAG TPA: Na+/H+ antiporter NhaA [Anaerolineales bacterium]|nr:Na+/H+ antiporter NhaA [Anaerolineales bacterium]